MRGNDQESFSFEAIGSSLKDEKTKEALAEIQFIYSNLSRR